MSEGGGRRPGRVWVGGKQTILKTGSGDSLMVPVSLGLQEKVVRRLKFILVTWEQGL